MVINIEFEGNESSTEFFDYLRDNAMKIQMGPNSNINKEKFDLEFKGCFPMEMETQMEPLELSFYGNRGFIPQKPKVKVKLYGDFITVKNDKVEPVKIKKLEKISW